MRTGRYQDKQIKTYRNILIERGQYEWWSIVKDYC